MTSTVKNNEEEFCNINHLALPTLLCITPASRPRAGAAEVMVTLRKSAGVIMRHVQFLQREKDRED